MHTSHTPPTRADKRATPAVRPYRLALLRVLDFVNQNVAAEGLQPAFHPVLRAMRIIRDDHHLRPLAQHRMIIFRPFMDSASFPFFRPNEASS